MINSHFITDEARAPLLLESVMNSQTQYYSRLKRPEPMTVGHSLFPQDKMTITRGMSINRDEIERFTGGCEDGGFSPHLVGSVSYRSPIDQKIHHSGFIYDLIKPKPDEPRFSLLFGSHDHTVPIAEMRLGRNFQSGFAD
jgi:hypothetical protein